MVTNEDKKAYKLTEQDRAILENYINIAKLLGNMFGKNCEVVIHSLDNLSQSVVYIHNGDKTGRSIGSPITDKGLSILNECTSQNMAVTKAYKTTSSNGHTMRSCTSLIYNLHGMPIGMFCLNFDLSSPLSALVDTLFNDLGEQEHDNEYFAADIDDLFTVTVNKVKDKVFADPTISIRKKMKVIINELYNLGLFKVKNSAAAISTILGISKDAVYLHLRNIKDLK